MQLFLHSILALIVWGFVIVVVAIAPHVLEPTESVAAILCATWAGFSMLILTFWAV